TPEAATSNDSPMEAQVLADPPPGLAGWRILGDFTSGLDVADWYKFNGHAGDHMRAIVFLGAPTMTLRLVLRCVNPVTGGADTTLAASFRPPKESNIQFTLPVDGTYALAIFRPATSPSGTYSAWVRKTVAVPGSVA